MDRIRHSQSPRRKCFESSGCRPDRELEVCAGLAPGSTSIRHTANAPSHCGPYAFGISCLSRLLVRHLPSPKLASVPPNQPCSCRHQDDGQNHQADQDWVKSVGVSEVGGCPRWRLRNFMGEKHYGRSRILTVARTCLRTDFRAP